DLRGGCARRRARALARPDPRRRQTEPRAMDTLIFDTANAHTFVQGFAFIGHHAGFLVHKALEQLALAGAALAIGAVVALPVGVALGHFPRGSTVAIGASTLRRPLPTI